MTFSLTSFNAHAGLRPRRDGVCGPYDLAGAIEGFDSDVVIVQETWWPDNEPSLSPSPVQIAAERLGAKVFELRFGRATVTPWPHVPRDGAGQGSMGLSVLSRLPARVLGTIALGTVPGDFTPERGGLHLEVEVDGTLIDLVGIHLTSRLPYGPPIQLRRLRARLPPPNRPAVVAGDCNFWGPGVLAFLRGWQRAARGRTWPARLPHSQIDHVLVRPGPTSAITIVDGEILGDVGSDHRPVRVVLRVRERSETVA